MSWRVLISCPNLLNAIDEHRAELDEAQFDYDTPRVRQQLREEELVEIIGGYDGVIAGDDEFTRTVIEAGTRLRVISKWGVGTDNIDREAARQHGVVVTNTPGAFGNEVADVAVGYLVMLARQLHTIDRRVRAGDWHKPAGISLEGRMLGVVGLGSVGSELVRRALAMRLHVLGTDPLETAREGAAAAGAEVVHLDELIERSHAIALTCPLTPETRGLIGRDQLRKARPGVLVINVSRGQLIDEDALVEALRGGHVGGAALDVFHDEPLPAGHPLGTMETVILGSHNASNTREAVSRVSRQAIENLVRELTKAAP